MKLVKDKTIMFINKINDIWNKFINLKVISFIFKFLPHNILLFILFIASLISLFNIFSHNYYEFDYYQDKMDGLMDPIIMNYQEISLEHVTLTNTPDKVCFRFAVYDRVNESTYDLTLFKGDEQIYNIPIQAKDIQEKEMYCIKIPTVLNNDNVREHRLLFRPVTVDSYNAVALYKNSETNEPAMYFVRTMSLFALRNVIIMIYALLFALICFFVNKKSIKVEHFYLLISIIYSFIIMFIIPPIEIPDGNFHYINAIHFSQLDLTRNFKEQFDESNIVVPSNYKCINYANPQKMDKVYSSKQIYDCLKEGKNIKTNDYHVNDRYKLGYIFSSLGYKIFDVFTNSPLILFYSGRLFNTLISILMIFFAIKLAPRYKEVLLAVATIPVFIQQMISYSYDSLLNSSVLLVIGIILNLIYNKDSNKKLMYFLLFILAIIIGNIKYLYLSVYLLLLYVPGDKKKYKKYLLIGLLIVIGVLVGESLLNCIINKTNVVNATSNVVKETNISYLLKNPLQLFPIIFNTLVGQTYYYIVGLFGYFGWFVYRLEDFYIIAYVLFIIYLINGSKRIESNKSSRVINILGLLLSIGAIFGALYFYYSKVGLDYVDGVQGRYFIPLLIPFMFVFMPMKNRYELNNKFIYTFINIMLFSFTVMLLLWYY